MALSEQPKNMDLSQSTPRSRRFNHLPKDVAVEVAWRTSLIKGDSVVPDYLEETLNRTITKRNLFYCVYCGGFLTESNVYTAYIFHGWRIYSDGTSYCEDCYFYFKDDILGEDQP